MFGDSDLIDLCLVVEDCAAAVDFYTAAFGGRETMRECLPDGHILHAEVAIGSYRLRLSEHTIPRKSGESAAALTVARPSPRSASAIDAGGATRYTSVADGEAAAVLHDPFGYRWSLRFVAPAPLG